MACCEVLSFSIARDNCQCKLFSRLGNSFDELFEWVSEPFAHWCKPFKKPKNPFSRSINPFERVSELFARLC